MAEMLIFTKLPASCGQDSFRPVLYVCSDFLDSGAYKEINQEFPGDYKEGSPEIRAYRLWS